MKLSKNFTLEELIRSNTANKYKINNKPNTDATAFLVELCEFILQPIRDKYGKPINITSGYRCSKLNKLVKGSSTSQHLFGQAADINNGVSENKIIFNIAKKLIEEGVITVGQLIDEKNYSWVHISLPTNKHKNQILHL